MSLTASAETELAKSAKLSARHDKASLASASRRGLAEDASLSDDRWKAGSEITEPRNDLPT
ncbi:MAG: hypothetical protein BGN83_17160 [Rhizobium sp. 63-7]|nr:MAG: hypothetical protein BGN83_17160 [Rhizobium sp. 63-7]